MRNMAYGVTISKIEPIQNKDRIVYIHFNENGYGVIADKSFEVGETVVYFEVDSILPVRPEFEFLRKRCFKENLNGFLIKNMKMNNLYSNGLILHSKDLELNKVKSGEDLTDKLNIKKYEPEEDASTVENKMPSWKKILKKFLLKHSLTRELGKKLFNKTKQKGDFPTWLISKSDEENIQNHKDYFEKYKNDLAYISIKMEGQSVTMLLNPQNKKFMVFGRNCSGNPQHISYAQKNNIEGKLRKAYKETKCYFALQGEFCAPNVQSGIYKNGEHWYIYTIKNLTKDKKLSLEEMILFCKKYDFETVPIILSGFKLANVYNNLNEIQDETEHIWFKPGFDKTDSAFFNDTGKKFPISKPEYHRSEGYVIRAIDESWSFKVKSNNYQIEGL
jgi:hypothetical protein